VPLTDPSQRQNSAFGFQGETLDRVFARGIINKAERDAAKREAVPQVRWAFLMLAAHASEAVLRRAPQQRVHRLTLDAKLQAALEGLAREAAAGLGPKLSCVDIEQWQGTADDLFGTAIRVAIERLKERRDVYPASEETASETAPVPGTKSAKRSLEIARLSPGASVRRAAIKVGSSGRDIEWRRGKAGAGQLEADAGVANAQSREWDRQRPACPGSEFEFAVQGIACGREGAS
jgi:hypothetical protein